MSKKEITILGVGERLNGKLGKFTRVIAENCLNKLRSGKEIKKNPKEIEEIADAIKSVG